MALSAQELKDKLYAQKIRYEPGYELGEGGVVPSRYLDYMSNAGGREITPEQAAARVGVAPTQFLSVMTSVPSTNDPYGDIPKSVGIYPQSTGFFDSFFNFFSDVGQGVVDLGKDTLSSVSQAVDTVVDPIADTLGVHPDVVKVAAAALGMYYAPSVGFTDAAGATVSEAAAAEAIASSGAQALAASGNLEAAAALAAGAESLAVPSMLPGATAFPVATAPLATMGAATPLTAAELAAADASAGLLGSSNALAPAAATGLSANALAQAELAAQASLSGTPTFYGYGGAGDVLGGAGNLGSLLTPTGEFVGYGGSNLGDLLTGYGGSSTALAPAAGVANALSAADLAAISGAEGLAVPATLTGLEAGAGLGAVDSLANVMSPGGGIDASIGQAYSDLGVGAGLGLGTAANALANAVSPGEGIDTSIGEAYADLGVGATGLPTDLLSSLAKFAKDYGVPLSALVSGITGSQAATNAAEIQAQSAREARALAEKMFSEQKALQEPYRAAGITAQNQLLNLLGLSDNKTAAEYGKYARPFGMADFQADPGYAFRLSEGMKALEASRAARGGLLSGATGKALQRYGQEMGSQEYTNAFNRYQTERANRLNPLAGLTASGQAAAAGQAANAGNYATTAGNLITDIGAAQAAGSIGSANAITNALNQFARYSAGQNLANQIRSSVYAPALGY